MLIKKRVASIVSLLLVACAGASLAAEPDWS